MGKSAFRFDFLVRQAPGCCPYAVAESDYLAHVPPRHDMIRELCRI